jgi:hypothetical protein
MEVGDVHRPRLYLAQYRFYGFERGVEIQNSARNEELPDEVQVVMAWLML